MSSLDDTYGHRRSKRRKVGNTGRRSVIDDIRKIIEFLDPLETEAEFELWMKVVIGLKSEFPLELRPAIDMAKADADDGKCYTGNKDWEGASFRPTTPARQFYKTVYSSVANFLFGRPVDAMLLRDDKQKFRSVKRLLFWSGPDADVDTQDQIELVIRIFPQVLQEFCSFNLGRHRFSSVCVALTSTAKSVPFVPLITGLLGEYKDWKFGDNPNPNKDNINKREDMNCLIELATTKLIWNACDFEVDIELRAQSLAAFEQFRTLKIDLGTFKYEKLDDLFGYIVSRGRQQKISIDLAQTQLRLLMKLDTTFAMALYSHLNSRKWHNFMMFEFAWDMVTQHHPHSTLLGSAFNRDRFANVCKIFGAEKARQAMDNRIKGALTQSMKEEDSGKSTNMLQDLVLEAAEYENVSLDGLYTLIRFDPEVALGGTRKRQSFS